MNLDPVMRNNAPWFGSNEAIGFVKPQGRTRREIADNKADKKKHRPHYQPPPPAQPEELEFRHEHWQQKRKLVTAAMQSAGTSVTAMNRFTNCGTDCIIEWNETAKCYRARGSYCHCRHCEPCMKAKATKMAKNLEAKLLDNSYGKYRFVTLTLKHRPCSLAEQIKRLYHCFRKLRTTKIWKRTQKGGCATLEVVLNSESQMWHPHLHIISEGDYISITKLSAEWLKITGDSMAVDVKMLDSGRSAAFYVGKYVTKGTNDEVWHNRSKSQEFVTAMKGVRTAATFGTWRGFKIMAPMKVEGTWKPLARLCVLVREANAGNNDARQLLALVRHRDYIYESDEKPQYAPPPLSFVCPFL